MKTGDLLLETQQKVVEISLDFNDLTSIQIGALRAIHDGRLDVDNASDRMMDVIYSLQDYNLVDDIFELTSTGEKAVKLALEIGGAERRKAAQNALLKQKFDDEEGEEEAYDTDYPTEDDMDVDWSIYQPNRLGTINDNL